MDPFRPRTRRLRRAALLFAAAIGTAAAEETVTPYAVLYGALERARAVEPYRHLRAVQRIESKLGVPPAAIRLRLETARGPLPVPIDPDGRLALPLDEAVRAENPNVVTNQPRGSLTLSLAIEIAVPPGLRVPAATLRAALDEVDALLAADPQPNAPQRARGVQLAFADPQAVVTVRGRGERLLMPDRDGYVILMRETDLGAGAEDVEFAQPPRAALPFFGR